MFVSIIVRSRNLKRPWTVSWLKTSGKANTRFTGVRKSHEFELMILALLSISNIPDVEPQLSVINFCNVCACCNLFIQILVKIDRSGRSIRTPNTECRMVVLKLFESNLIIRCSTRQTWLIIVVMENSRMLLP